MAIHFHCPSCGQKYSVDSSLAGKRVKCKACSTVVTIPTSIGAATPPSSPGSGARAPKPPPPPSAPDDRFGLDELEADPGEPEMPALGGRGPVRSRSYGNRGGLLGDPTTRMAVFWGGGVIGLVLLVAVVVAVTRRPSSSERAFEGHHREMAAGISALDQLTEALQGVQDEAGARDAEPKVRQIVDSIAEIRRRTRTLAALSEFDDRRIDAEFGPLRARKAAGLGREVARVRQIPGSAEVFRPIGESIRIED